MTSCPMCAETIEDGAERCVHCGEALTRDPSPARVPGGLSYDVMQDKVGLVPNLRVKDNVIQAIVTVVALVLGVAIGGVLGGAEGALVGALAGLVVGGLGSGFVLMILGLVRR
ncbi:MAG: hypothetical protein KF878_17920 [Planctomycetes bacterium]|nr:hypothetical protein [Planctomycetota bacterium]